MVFNNLVLFNGISGFIMFVKYFELKCIFLFKLKIKKIIF